MPDPDITFVLPGFRPTGGIRATLELADGLRSRGWETRILVPERTLLAPFRSAVGMLQRYAPRAASPLVQRFAPAGRSQQDWFPLRTPVEVAGHDLVAAVSASGAVVATSYRTAEELLRWKGRSSRGVYLIQHYETWSGPTRRVDATWRGFDRCIVTAPWLADLASDRFGKRDDQVALAPYGVDLHAFTPDPGTRDRGGCVVGFVWDDRPIKGGDDVIEALSRLRDRGVAMQVRAYGIGERPLPDWVEMSGVTSGRALTSFYRDLDVFVAPGRQESGPMGVTEAMATGVAVVATDVGDVRLWSDDGAAVRIVPPAQPLRLAEAIHALADDTNTRERLGSAGRVAIERYPWERMVSEVEEALVGWGLGPGLD